MDISDNEVLKNRALLDGDFLNQLNEQSDLNLIMSVQKYFIKLEHHLMSTRDDMILLHRGEGAFLPPVKVNELIAEKINQVPLNLYPNPMVEPELYELLIHWLVKKGVITSDCGYPNDLTQLLITAGGTTQLLHCVLEPLWQEEGIVLLPVPSYGLFFTAIASHNLQVKLIPLSSSTDWLLTPELLLKTIKDIDINNYENNKKQKIKAILFINPSNPSGKIYTQAMINPLASILKEHNILVIDDILHTDMELSDNKKQGYFNAAPDNPSCVTIFGPSKTFSAAGYRTGVAFINDVQLANTLNWQHYHLQSGTSIINRLVMEACYEDNADIRDYLKRNKKEYAERHKLLQVLVNGKDAIDKKSLPRIVNKISEITNNNLEDYLQGVPGVETLNKPEAGLFQVIQFSGWYGKHFGKIKISNGVVIAEILAYYGIMTVPDMAFGHSVPACPYVRVNVAAFATTSVMDSLFTKHTHPNRVAHAVLLKFVEILKLIGKQIK